MKLHHLEALVSVADAGSIRAAARLLQLSQAAVTKALRELESEQQLALLVRTAGGVSFTDAGHRLLKHARLVIGQMERASEELAKLRGDQAGKLAIAVTPLVMVNFLPETVSLFRKQMPSIQLEIFEGLTAVALPRLREGALDFGILALPVALTDQEFDIEPLFAYEPCIIARRGHPSLGRRSLHDLLDQDWALNFTPASYESVMQRVFWQHGAKIAPARLHCAHSYSLLNDLVRYNNMLTFCPEPLLLSESMRDWAQALTLDEQFEPLRVSVISLRNATRSQAAKCFVDCLCKVIRSQSRSAGEANRMLFDQLDLLF
ncbi:LysR family transcriptional regulator [Trinickia violacea]|uniref:LysR family transcriptional regulator n=1 Tax=Trinickia violacea TaxID=2571746 RepID=A0A4P8J3J7_9BURK|nr:LysR substrate-binding domain-containing protein [Trinickia violacea]QCP54464.1 LysR family transcriptional regulator [Trinickia violacea]